MVWTPFGKSTTSTAPDVVNDNMPINDPAQIQTFQSPPVQTVQSVPMVDHSSAMPQPQHPQHEEGTWFNENNFEGQLAVDVYQTLGDIIIKAPIAGVSPNAIDIAITDDVVTVKGHRKMDDNIAAEDYYCQECYYGVFSRSIILPVAVVTDQANATFSNGILTITIPKAANARTKKLEVRAL